MPISRPPLRLVCGMFLWVVIAMFIGVGTTSATQRYVAGNGNNANAGTVGSPYLTILKCAQVAVAGDICNIRGGFTYTESDITPTNNGTSGNPIIFQVEPATGTATLKTPFSSQTQGAVFYVLNRSYITIQNLTFANFAFGWAIRINSSQTYPGPFTTTNITIQNNTFSAVGQRDTAPADSAIQVQSVVYTRNAGPNIIVQNNTFDQSYGLMIHFGSDVNNSALGNIITNVRERVLSGNTTAMGAGVFHGGDSGLLVKNNTMSNITVEGGHEGLGIWCDVGGTNAIYDGNIIHDLTVRAILAELNCVNITIQRNVIYSTWGGIASTEYYNGTTTNLTVQNNTVYNNAFYGIAFPAVTTATIKNNISMNNGVSQIMTSDRATGLTFSNNLWYSTTTSNIGLWNLNCVTFNNCEYTSADRTLASWVSVSGETNAKNVNPLFTNLGTGDFTLQSGSPALDAGINVGLPFTGSAPDLGAYEFAPSVPPTAPTNLIITPISGTSLQLNWQGDGSATTYSVYRCSGPGCTVPTTGPIATLISPTSYVDSSIVAGTAYGYTVVGVNASGAGPPSSALSTTARYSTTFTGNENPLSESSAFTTVATPRTLPMQKLGGVAEGTALSNTLPQYARLAVPTMGSNQFSQATIAANSGNGDVLLMTRLQSSSNASSYLLDARASTNVVIYRIDDTGSAIGDMPLATFAAAAVGDVIRLQSDGSTHSYYKNYVLQGSITDATYIGGQPGLGVYVETTSTLAGHTLDLWSGGDFANVVLPSAPTALGVTTASDTSLQLNWATDGTATTYNVYRCQGAGCTVPTAPGPVATLIGTTSYLDTGLLSSTSYSYKVSGVNAGGEGLQSTVGTGVTAALVVPPPQNWWKFDEVSGTTAADSADASPGTLCQGATCPQAGPSWIAGQVNGAISCDGVNDRVQVAHSAALDITGDMTIAFWGKLLSTTNLSSGVAIIGKGQTTTGFPSPYSVGLGNASTPHWLWYHHHNADNDYSSQLTFTTATVPVGTWQHVVFVRTISDKTVSLYINGSLSQAIQWTTDDPATASGFPIQVCGDAGLSSIEYANIALDELKLWNVALSAAHVQSVAAVVDVTAPLAPTGLNITVGSSSQLNLAWTAPAGEAASSYKLYRCTPPICLTTLYQSLGNVLSYPDVGLTVNVAYSYQITALDNAGNESVKSTLATGTPIDTTNPGTVTGLNVTSINASQIGLAWNAATDDVAVAGYNLYRCTPPTCTPTLFQTLGNVLGYLDTPLLSLTGYTYQVRARDAAGNLSVAFSNSVTATTTAMSVVVCQ